MPTPLTTTELQRAQQEFGAGAIESRAGQSFLRPGFSLSTLSDVNQPAPTPAQELTGSAQTTSDLSGLRTDVSELLEGIQSPFDANEIRTAREQQQAQIREIADLRFDPLIEQARERGEAEVGGGRAQLGVGRGLGLSTAGMSFISSLEDQADRRIADLQKQKAEFIANGDFKVAEQFNTQIAKVSEAKNNLIFKKIDIALKIGQEERQQGQAEFDMDIQAINTALKLPAGQTFQIGDTVLTGLAKEEVDPFFTGSNVVSLMKEIPEGEVRKVIDPNTGNEITLTGLRSDDPAIKIITSTDDRGNVTITRFSEQTGEIVNQVSAGGIGKTKAAPISLILGQQQSGALSDASAAIEASKGSDGFANTGVYTRERQKFIQATGDPTLFDSTFKQNLNPSDPQAQRFLTKSELDIAQGGITPDQEQSLRALGIDQSLIDAAKASGLSMQDLLD